MERNEIKQTNTLTVYSKARVKYLIVLSSLVVIIFDLSFYNGKIEFLNSSNYISQNIVILIMTMMSIFFASSFITVQLFNNRYPLKFIENYAESNIKPKFFNYIFNIIIGLLLLCLNFDLQFTKLFYVAHSFYCLILFKNFCVNYKMYNPQNSINHFKDRILDQINSNCDLMEVENSLDELRNYSEESLSKNEIIIAKHLLGVYKDILCYFLPKRDEIMNAHKLDKNDIAKLEKSFFVSIIEQITKSINYDLKDYIEECFVELKSVLKKCIEFNKIISFDNFCESIDRLFKYCITRKNSIVCIFVIQLYSNLYIHNLKNDAREEWLENLKSKIRFCNLLSYLDIDTTLIKIIYNEYFRIFSECIKQDNFSEYKDIVSDFLHFTYVSVNKDCNFVNSIITNSVVLLNNCLENKNEYFNEYIEMLFSLAKFGLYNNNEEICLQVRYLFERISENLNYSDPLSDDIRKKEVSFALEVSFTNERLTISYIPNYLEIINKAKSDLGVCKRIVEEYCELTNKILFKGKHDLTLYQLDNLNKIVLIYNKEQRGQQESFLNLYERLFYSCINLNDSTKFHIVAAHYSEMIEILNKNDKISKSLAEKIMDIYGEVGKYALEEKQTSLVLTINDDLVDLLKKVTIIIIKTDLFLNVIEKLFQIGLDSVEKNFEDIIRDVSNKLGWIGKEAIENKRRELVEIILGKAVILMNICDDFMVSTKVMIFIGTLFVILGGFSVSKSNISCTELVVKYAKKINRQDLLKISKKAREYESVVWNSMMAGEAKRNINIFFEKLTRT
jgi:hypothetical protein